MMVKTIAYLFVMKEQAEWPEETAAAKTFVQMAIVYRRHEVAVYRNGRDHARCTMPPIR
jgi:hypothetical protein